MCEYAGQAQSKPAVDVFISSHVVLTQGAGACERGAPHIIRPPKDNAAVVDAVVFGQVDQNLFGVYLCSRQNVGERAKNTRLEGGVAKLPRSANKTGMVPQAARRGLSK